MANQYTKAKELGLQMPKLSEETRKKLGNVHRGKHLSEETKRKLSETMRRKTGLTRRQIKLIIERFAICYKTHNYN